MCVTDSPPKLPDFMFERDSSHRPRLIAALSGAPRLPHTHAKAHIRTHRHTHPNAPGISTNERLGTLGE